MAPWDAWGAQPRPRQEFDLAFFDELAALTRDPDDAFAEVRRRYKEEGELRVPLTVFNALNQRPEAINQRTHSGSTIAPSAESLSAA
jgi:hypothetical protein